MRIALERTGGFTGIPLTVELDTKSLPEMERLELEDMVENLSFFQLPNSLVSSRPEADRFTYKVTVHKGFRKHTVEVGESAVPEAMGPLLERLVAAGRAARGKSQAPNSS